MNERMKRWAWPAGALGVALLARLPSLRLLLDRDEGEFASLAWLWRAGYGLPYRDYLEQKPPLTLLPHALAQALAPGDEALLLRWISLAWVLATVLALYSFVRALAARGHLGRALRAQAPQARAAAGAAALAAALAFSSAGTQSLAANTETWQTLPLLAALALAFLEPRPSAGRWLACGLALGAGSLFKQPLLAGVLLLPWAAGERSLLKAVALTAAGAGLAWGLAWAPFALAQGGWDFLNCTLAYNQAYVLAGQSEAWRRALGLALHLAPELGFLTLLAGAGALRLRREGGRWGWLAAWGGLGLVTLAASGRYYPHYAIVALGPLAAMAGLGAQGLWLAARGPWARRGAALALLTGLTAWASMQAPLWGASSAEDLTWRFYQVPSFASAPEAARRLQALCPADKRLFLWGDDAEIFYLSRRAPATRFLFTYPFTGEAPPWPGGDEELQQGLLDPRTGAAVLARGLDPQRPLQSALLHALQDGFRGDHQVPGWVLGARR